MSAAVFTAETADVLRMIRKAGKLCAQDPTFGTELYDRTTAGIRMQYFAPRGRGLSLETMLLVLVGEGFASPTADCLEFMAALEQAFFDRCAFGAKRPKRRAGTRAAEPDYAAAEKAAEKRRKNRLRRFECQSCGLTVYHGSDTPRAACLPCMLAECSPDVRAAVDRFTFTERAAVGRPLSGAALASVRAARGQDEAVPF